VTERVSITATPELDSDARGSEDDDELLRALAGAPMQVPSVVHLLGPGSIIEDKYRIDGTIGAGAMGTVFRATDLRLQRPVAIKVHHGRATSLERLRREARMLARLSHPNVVTVLEVGSHEGAPYVAMEYVQGDNARRWARRPGRTWREIVAVYDQAARGLAAAHAVGIVHRDFKPDNLLVGEDGRARVADFGLAAARAGIPSDAESVAPSIFDATADDHVAVEMTLAGSLVGTPAYVAPEQIRSSRVDARADQFSFFASLFEALYGELPFPGRTAAEVLARILDGEVTEPTARNGVPRVPRWLHAVMMRGMARDPAARWPDMDAAREALAGPRSRRVAGMIAASVAIVAATWFATAPRATDPRCAGDPSGPSRARRAELGAGFAVNDDVADVWSRLDRKFEARAQGHSAAWVTACAGDRDDATPAALATMRTRLSCLDDEQALTDALVDELAAADRAELSAMLGAAATWGDPLSCIASTPAQVGGAASTPIPHTARALLMQVRAASVSGEALAAEGLAGVALAHAQATGDDRIIARALLARGRARLGLGQYEAAVEDLIAAYNLAQRVDDGDTLRDAAVILASSGRDNVGGTVMEWVTRARRNVHRWPDDARAQVELQLIEAELRADHEDFEGAQALLDDGDAIVARAELPGQVAARLWLSRSAVAEQRGDFGRAVSDAERARQLLEEDLGPDHYTVGMAWARLGHSYDAAGNYSEARVHLRRALELFSGDGPDSFEVMTLVQLATLETLLGNSAQALADLDDADALTTALGIDELDTDFARNEARGLALYDLGRFEEAQAAFEEVIRLREATWGSAHPMLRVPLLNLALAARSLGRIEVADAALARAVRIQEDLSEDDPLAADVYHGYGFALLDRGDLDAAQVQFERAEASLQRTFGDEHADHAWPALGLGRIALARDRATEALAWFDRAANAWADGDTDDESIAELTESRVEALWQLGRRDEAIAAARAGLVARPGHDGLQTWLDARARDAKR
jgi:eukaryotic-like serine/threonine-protein kinase